MKTTDIPSTNITNLIKVKNPSRCPSVLRECFFILYVMVSLFYSVLMTYFTALAFKSMLTLTNSFEYQVASSLVSLWDSYPPIIDITLTSTKRCPSDYSLAYEYYWPGFTPFCSCPIQLEDTLYYENINGKCSDTQISNSSCTYYSGLNDTQLSFWRSLKKICIKRGSESLYDAPVTCDNNTNYRYCGTGENKVCIKNIEPCPISYISNSFSIPTGDYQILSRKIAFNQNISLIFGSDPNLFPLALLKISNTAFCGIEGRTYLPDSQNFNHNNIRDQCEFPDLDFKTVDEMGLLDYYQLNKLNFTNSIPSYPKPSNEYSMLLGSRSYLFWSFSCRNYEERSLSETIERLKLKREKAYIIGLLVVMIISVGISGVIMPVLDFIKRYCLGPKKRVETKMLKIPALILEKFFKLLLFPLILINYMRCKDNVLWIVAVIDNQCSTTYFNTFILQYYKDYTTDLQQYFSYCLGLWVFIGVVDLIYLTVRFFTDKPEKYVEKIKSSKSERKPLKNVVHPAPKEKVLTVKSPNLVKDDDIKKLEDEILNELKKVDDPTNADVKLLELELKAALNEKNDDNQIKKPKKLPPLEINRNKVLPQIEKIEKEEGGLLDSSRD